MNSQESGEASEPVIYTDRWLRPRTKICYSENYKIPPIRETRRKRRRTIKREPGTDDAPQKTQIKKEKVTIKEELREPENLAIDETKGSSRTVFIKEEPRDPENPEPRDPENPEPSDPVVNETKGSSRTARAEQQAIIGSRTIPKKKDMVVVEDGEVQRYEISYRHFIDKTKPIEKLEVTAGVIEYKELELRWDFPENGHKMMAAYGVYYGKRKEQVSNNGTTNEDDTKFRNKDYRQIGFVTAMPLPMRVVIKFDQDPLWYGLVYFALRALGSNGELGPFSDPVTCMFEHNANYLRIVKTDLSKLDLSGPDPLTDADGLHFFPVPIKQEPGTSK